MLRAAIAIVAAALLAGVCSSALQISSHESDAQDQNAKYEAAIAYCEKLLASSSAKPFELIQARADLATAYFMLHRYSESLQALQPMLTQAHGSGAIIPARAWTVAGLDYLELNQTPSAVESFRKALELDPNAGTARMGLGDAYARSGRMSEAAQEYEAQTERTPSLAEPWYKLGLAHAKLASELPQTSPEQFGNSVIGQRLAAEEQLAGGNNLEAARRLFHLLHEAPDQPEIHGELGMALLGLGYPKSAERQFHEELSKNPLSPQAALGLAQVSALNGDWGRALEQMEQLADSQPGELRRLLDFPPCGSLRQAWTDHRLQLPDELDNRPMASIWKSWLSGRDADETLLTESGRAAAGCDSSKNEAAGRPGAWLSEACYRTLVAHLREQRRLTTEELIKLTEGEFRLAEHDAALRDARRILQADPRNAWGAYWLSKAHAALAEDCFVKVGVLSPDSSRMHEMLAQHYLGWSDYPKAKAEYLTALRMAPDLPDLHLGLGSVYWKTGELPLAEAELRKTLELVPESAAADYELGDIYIQEHQWQRAIQHLQHAADSSFKKEARIDLAKAEDALGQTEQAIHALLPIEKEDLDGQIHFLLAALYRKLGETDQVQAALAAFKRIRDASLRGNENEFDVLEGGDSSNKSTSSGLH